MTSSGSVTLRPGDVFHGRYRVVRSIAAGAMGAVYEVTDDKTNSRRALKVMLPSLVEDADKRARFAQEAKVTGGIESDHIIRVSDAGVDDGTRAPFLVMDLLRGDDLGRILEQRKALPPAEVVTYMTQAALALDKTHAAGIVHRDLKPDNLFVTMRDDGSPCVKILDFGIAKVVADSDEAKKTKALGTPLYMSPEQVRGGHAIGPRVDIYALAHVAYALLVGEAYWTEESAADTSLYHMLLKVVEGAREAPSARGARRGGARLPPAFDAWFQRATAVDPNMRFDRATVAIAALGEALRGAPAASPTGPAAMAAPAPAAMTAQIQPHAAAMTSPANMAPPAYSPYGPQPVAALPPAQRSSPVRALLIGGAVVLVLCAGGAGLYLTLGSAASDGRPIYADTFDSDKGRWSQPVGGDRVVVSGGKLVATSTSAVTLITSPAAVPPESAPAFTMEVDITRQAGPPGVFCGVVWRWDEAAGSYAAGFNGTGQFSATRYLAKTGELQPITQLKASAAIKQGTGAVNRLKVVVRGSSMTFLVNGQEVDRVVDAQFARGKFAFYVGAGLTVAYDDLSISAPR